MKFKDAVWVALFVTFICLFKIQSERLITALDNVTVNYSSHNDSTTQVLNFPPGQLEYDIAHGDGAFEEEK